MNWRSIAYFSIALIIIAITFPLAYMRWKDCSDKGGQVMRTIFNGYTCVIESGK